MITLKESAGDVRLSKFIIIITDKISGELESNYYPEISSYFFIKDFLYNYTTGESDEWFEHQDLLESLPEAIQNTVEAYNIIVGSITVSINRKSKKKNKNDSEDKPITKNLEIVGKFIPREIESFIKKKMFKYGYEESYIQLESPFRFSLKKVINGRRVVP